MSPYPVNQIKDSAAVRLAVLFTLFFIFLLIAGGIAASLNLIDGLSEHNVMLISSAFQGIVAFCVPAWLTARFISNKPDFFLGLNGVRIGIKPFIGVVIVYILALPAMNELVVWNESIHFPDWASGIETTLRNLEETNGKVAEILLGGNSFLMMLVTVVVVGIITGFSEELFFRGAMQKIFSVSGVKNWIAIWGAAFIFSTMHFQFFGFVPRLIMGAFFGYIFIMTGSLWPSIFAHALNNSIVVVGAWLTDNGVFSDFEKLGVSDEGSFPTAALTSLLATVLFFYAFRDYFFKKDNAKIEVV